MPEAMPEASMKRRPSPSLWPGSLTLSSLGRRLEARGGIDRLSSRLQFQNGHFSEL